jgi:hypothetical protein
MHQGHQVVSPQARDWRLGTSLPGAPKPTLSTMAGRASTGGPMTEAPPADRQGRITLAPAPESARAAREFTTATLRKWHLDPLVSEAVLIASELVTNAINHGGQAGAPLELTWSYQVSRLILVVTDRSAEPPVMTVADADAESGHGLQIVGTLAAAWGWTMLGTGEKAVWAALPLPLPAAGRGPLASGPPAAVTRRGSWAAGERPYSTTVPIPGAAPGRQAAGQAADRGHPDPFPAAR